MSRTTEGPREIRVPAHIQPYVTAIGIEKTVRFLLAFGGSYVYLSTRPQDRSAVVQELGKEATIALAEQAGVGSARIPTGKPFIAAHLRYNKQLTINEISRRLHVTDVTVRKWLADGEARQLDLFGP